MVQVIALGLVGGLAWYAYKSLQDHMGKVGDELKKADGKARKGSGGNAKVIDELERGEDGVYRPKKDD